MLATVLQGRHYYYVSFSVLGRIVPGTQPEKEIEGTFLGGSREQRLGEAECSRTDPERS